MAGIYLHVPFCRQACHYCDFHFSTNREGKAEMMKSMVDEILLRKDYLAGENVKTIYFGGGTPSLLEPRDLDLLLGAISSAHPVSPEAEITLEANPDDLTIALLKDFRSMGINRISIGIQSFDDRILRYLNRVHDARMAIDAVEFSRTAGFDNFSIDLIYAIPGLTQEGWEKSLSRALALNPPHISAYTLTIEEKTAFGNWLAKGRLQPVDDTLAAEQLQMLMDVLSANEYTQYEISNFARPGFESRHNSSYWQGEKYLGIGPSAHSYDQHSRQFNIANNNLYVRSLRDKTVPFEREVLKKNDYINEYILTTLRTNGGCNLANLKQNFDYDLMEHHSNYLRQLQDHQLITIQDSQLRLTAKGRLVADKISSDLFLIE
jgi:oxygen-independent coproporphyrinogen-3 oxidase